MQKTFFSADYHFGHSNIINLCHRPFTKPGICPDTGDIIDEPDIEAHDNTIKHRHNEVVTINDILYFLGDGAFRCSPEHAAKYLKSLNCKKMYYLWGNHDKAVFQAIQKGLFDNHIKSGRIEFIGKYDKNQRTSLNIKVNGQKIVLFHYGLRSWDSAFRGAWHLYGHSHSNLPSLHKSMDVGVDTNNFYPYEFTDLQRVMNNVSTDFSES